MPSLEPLEFIQLPGRLLDHLRYTTHNFWYGKEKLVPTVEIFNCPTAGHISSAPILFVYPTFSFRFGADKTEIDKIWTTKRDGPEIHPYQFYSQQPKILRGVSGAYIVRLATLQKIWET